MVIQHNLPAMNSHRQMGVNNKTTSKNLEKLSSGFRINRAADDAAGLAISEKMRGQIRGLGIAEMNIQHGIGLIQTAEGGMEEITSMLQRQRELTVQALNGTYTDEDRDLMQREIDRLTKGIDDVAISTRFNGTQLLAPITDIIFAIDISGSMGGPLNNIRSSIKSFLEELPPESRVGFVLYSDVTISEPMSYQELTSDVDAITEFLDKAAILGGGDEDESGLEGIVGAIDRLKDSPNNKHIIFITDAPSHTSDSGKSSHSIAEVNKLLKENNITFHGIGDLLTSKEHGQLAGLETGTGGSLLSINDMSKSTAWYPDVSKTKPIYIQVGANQNENIQINTFNCSTRSLGTNTVALYPFEKANQSLLELDNAINTISSYRADCGAAQNRLEHASRNNGNIRENLQAAESSIRDVDMAKEMMQFTKNNILVQASQSMLAQSNQLPQGVLSLLR